MCADSSQRERCGRGKIYRINSFRLSALRETLRKRCRVQATLYPAASSKVHAGAGIRKYNVNGSVGTKRHSGFEMAAPHSQIKTAKITRAHLVNGYLPKTSRSGATDYGKLRSSFRQTTIAHINDNSIWTAITCAPQRDYPCTPVGEPNCSH